MTPTRSLAASLVALGIASAFTAPLPAFAASAPCARAENYAAQSGAETLRINRLDLRTEHLQRSSTKPSKPDSVREDGSATDRLSKPSIASPSATPSTDSDGPSPSASASADDDNGDDPGDDTDGTGGSGAGEVVGEIGNVAESDTASGSVDKSDREATGQPSSLRLSSTGATEGASSSESASVQDVGVGQARTALTANAQVNSAAVARMLDGQASGSGSLSKPLVQQAPPGHDQPATRATPDGQAGPLKFGAGELSSLARWDAGMACGATTGNVSRSTSSLSRVDVLPGEDGALVGVPGTLSSESTTALDRPAEAPRTVASATVAGGRMTLANGQVRLALLQPPVLTASMTAGDGGQISYRPAVVEVSGPGIVTRRLSTTGESVNISLGDGGQQSESTPADSSSALDGIRPGARLPLPEIAGLPSIQAPSLESAPVSGSGTRITVALGSVRQAKKGHAIAARVNAVTIAITQGSASHGDDSQSKDDEYGRDSRAKHGYGGGCQCKQTDCQCEQHVTAEVTVGALEAAAAAPGSPATTAPAPVAGTALPVTGPEAESVALGGLGLLVAGTAALFVGRRRRRPTP